MFGLFLKQNLKLNFTSVLAYIKNIKYNICWLKYGLFARTQSFFLYLLASILTFSSCSVCSFLFTLFSRCAFCVFSPFPHAPTASYSLSVFEAASRCRTESLLLGFCSWPRTFHNSICRVIFLTEHPLNSLSAGQLETDSKKTLEPP